MRKEYWLALSGLIAAALIAGFLLGRSGGHDNGAERVERSFRFTDEAERRTAGFVDLPLDDQAQYDLFDGSRLQPAGLDGAGLFLAGNNWSGDLLMYLIRPVDVTLMPSTL